MRQPLSCSFLCPHRFLAAIGQPLFAFICFRSQSRTWWPPSEACVSIHLLVHDGVTAQAHLPNPEMRCAAAHRISKPSETLSTGGWPVHHYPWCRSRTIHMQALANCRFPHFISCFFSGMLVPMCLFCLPLLPVSFGSGLFGVCCSFGSYFEFWRCFPQTRQLMTLCKSFALRASFLASEVKAEGTSKLVRPGAYKHRQNLQHFCFWDLPA